MTSLPESAGIGDDPVERVSPNRPLVPLSRTSPLLPGHVLDERFLVKDLINKGGMASVFEAVDLTTGDLVALKIPLSKYQTEPLYVGRFALEEETGLYLDHPSLLHIFPTKNKSRPYIVMERLRGQLLSELLKDGRRLPAERALPIAIAIAKAVEYMHEREVLHRDLKPGNVMICDDGSIRIIDFGLSTMEGRGKGGPLGIPSALGTPDYMPPEHVKGQRGDQRSDVYCLGVILYEMLSGSVPFLDEDIFAVMNARVVGDPLRPRKLAPDLSLQLEEIILHAMERDPAQRYPRMADFRKDLEAPDRVVVTGRAERLIPPPAWKILWRRVRHFVLTLLIILIAMLLLVLFVSVGGKPRVRTHSRASEAGP